MSLKPLGFAFSLELQRHQCLSVNNVGRLAQKHNGSTGYNNHDNGDHYNAEFKFDFHEKLLAGFAKRRTFVQLPVRSFT
jgi:hypothetical protein